MEHDDIEQRLTRALHAYLDDAHPAGPVAAPARRRRQAGAPTGLLAVAAAVLLIAVLAGPALTRPGGLFAPAGATGGEGQVAGPTASGGIADGLVPGAPGASGAGGGSLALGSPSSTAPGPVAVLSSAVPSGAGSAVPRGGGGTSTTAVTGTATARPIGTVTATRAPQRTPSPPPTPSVQGGTLVVTLAQAETTVHLAVGERLELSLGTLYLWSVSLQPAGSAVLAAAPGPLASGQQAAWIASRAGSVTVTAVGDPPCRQSKPPCMMPSRVFTLTVVVS